MSALSHLTLSPLGDHPWGLYSTNAHWGSWLINQLHHVGQSKWGRGHNQLSDLQTDTGQNHPHSPFSLSLTQPTHSVTDMNTV